MNTEDAAEVRKQFGEFLDNLKSLRVHFKRLQITRKVLENNQCLPLVSEMNPAYYVDGKVVMLYFDREDECATILHADDYFNGICDILWEGFDGFVVDANDHTTCLHDMICKAPSGMIVQHVGSRFDNRREMLVFVKFEKRIKNKDYLGDLSIE